jgi:photosystem II stability/assembly factor-like uncharacterized protein
MTLQSCRAEDRPAVTLAAQQRWRDVSLTSYATDEPEISAVTFLTPEHGWILTFTQLRETNDGGKSWVERYSSDGTRYFSSLLFSDADSGWIVGSAVAGGVNRPLVLHTDDGGKTWSEQPVSPGWERASERFNVLTGISRADDAMLWAVGSTAIIHTSDGGRTWETQYVNTDERRLTDIACIDRERAVVVGDGGIILRTQDGGATWKPVESGVSAHLISVGYFEGMLWAVGEGGVVLRAAPDSLKWETLPKATPKSLYDIHIEGNQGWIVGERGTMLYTSDGGKSWREVESPTTFDLTTLYFINPHQGWAGGSGTTILHLTD